MSKNGKIDYPLDKGDREDVRWFENYEKCGKTKHLERLKKKDILNYIRDVEQNCRLEVSSGDEDYAGTRKSSDCSVIRCSGSRNDPLFVTPRNAIVAARRENFISPTILILPFEKILRVT
ncbi:PREDICTED: uncharacterized protein LOC105458636 isoform X3 [Wasmannia auropunctata]|uniref:uncharacterized protein LOC105458636 isoform X3 n=1 Tax=Wasmannia auropunctata TaxID=64793 RepID=UPI0005EEDCC4|nr:PREDICTED: uncharacterized protein LOC105458636 isoform X3 [Wasmannia auropunctata]